MISFTWWSRTGKNKVSQKSSTFGGTVQEWVRGSQGADHALHLDLGNDFMGITIRTNE